MSFTLTRTFRRKPRKNGKTGSSFESTVSTPKRPALPASFFSPQIISFESKYATVMPLGEGSFGRVWKAVLKTDVSDEQAVIPFAVKEIKKLGLTEAQTRQLKLESSALAKLHHPNIIGFFERFEDQNFVHIVMEYVSGGTLANLIQRKQGCSESHAKKYIFQITSALEYCNRIGVVHRDIKPGNILVTGSLDSYPVVKLIDFGFSALVDLKIQAMETKKLNNWVGTLSYVSPEIVKRHIYNFKTDFWSLGVTMFEVLSGGVKPFDFDERKQGGKHEMMEKISEGCFGFEPVERWDTISMDAKDLILSLLTVEPDQRFGPRETLAHIWLQEAAELEYLQYLQTGTLTNSGKSSTASVRLSNSFKKLLQKNESDPASILKKLEHAANVVRFAKKLYSLKDEEVVGEDGGGGTKLRRTVQALETSQNFNQLDLSL